MKKLLIIPLFALLILLVPLKTQAIVDVYQGGTGLTTSTPGDLLIGTSSKQSLSKISVGSTGQVLSVVAGLPAWVATSTLSSVSTNLVAWTNGGSFTLVSATRDANEAITVASIIWPDGSTGTFTTDTASTLFPGAIDAYHVTYVPSSGPTKTITQTAVTRDANGAVTAQPQLTIT